MIGEHTFTLDAYHLGPHDRAMSVLIWVCYDLEIEPDADGQPDLQKATPTRYSFTVGGDVTMENPWNECVGPVRAWVLLQTEKLGLEDYGVSDLEAREALAEEGDTRRFEREHAAGAL